MEIAIEVILQYAVAYIFGSVATFHTPKVDSPFIEQLGIRV